MWSRANYKWFVVQNHPLSIGASTYTCLSNLGWWIVNWFVDYKSFSQVKHYEYTIPDVEDIFLTREYHSQSCLMAHHLCRPSLLGWVGQLSLSHSGVEPSKKHAKQLSMYIASRANGLVKTLIHAFSDHIWWKKELHDLTLYNVFISTSQ